MGHGFKGHKTIRLRDFDYGSQHTYFITIVTTQRRCNLSRIDDGQLHLSKFGKVVLNEWDVTLTKRPFVACSQFLVMPNHIHAMISLRGPDKERALSEGSFHRFQQVRPNTVSTVIGGFKSAVTRNVNRLRGTAGARFWQDGFYDHVIRSEDDLYEIATYIDENVLRWELDIENPEGRPDQREQEFWKDRLNLNLE